MVLMMFRCSLILLKKRLDSVAVFLVQITRDILTFQLIRTTNNNNKTIRIRFIAWTHPKSGMNHNFNSLLKTEAPSFETTTFDLRSNWVSR